MQPKRHSGQRTKQRANTQVRRVDLNDWQRGKGSPGRRAKLVRGEPQRRRVRRATGLVSQIVQEARDMVNMGRHPTVLLKVKEATQGVA